MPSVINVENTFLFKNGAAIHYDQIQPAITVIITSKNYKDKIPTTLCKA